MQTQNGKDLEKEEELEELEGINERLIRQHKLPLSAQSAFSYIPPQRKNPPELSYFHQESKEKMRPQPVLSSSEYGRHIDKPVEELIRDHVRINRIQAEFYRKNEIACLTDKDSRT